jgi:hypothetical protein
MPDASMYGPVTLTLTSGLAQFQVFLPNFREIRQGNPTSDPGLVADVRMGELAAVLVTLGVGATASAVTGSSTPTVAAALTSLGLVLLYESALRAPGGAPTTAVTET